MPGHSPADWAAIARDYAAGTLRVDDLCILHGVAWSVLYRRIKSEGWPLRNESGRRARRHLRPDLTKRLLVALELKMTQFEKRMIEAGAPVTSADSERDARTLNTLVRLFEKLKGFGEKAAASTRSRAATQAAGDPAASAGKDAHDADRLRQELAQRLEKLRAGLGG